MKKYLIPTLIATALAITSFGQTTKPKLNQLKNDPLTMRQAAKADARLVDKKNISDTSAAKIIATKKEKHNCKFKRRDRTP